MNCASKAMVVHVPYLHRGGEDVHVEALLSAYQDMGIETKRYPLVPLENKISLGPSIQSLLPTDEIFELDEFIEEFKPHFFHLHNIFPLLGPRFLRWLGRRKIPTVMTIHNHRFFCTNGLALRDGKVCKDCFSSKVPWRALLHNCNGNIPRSVYHSLALSQIRRNNLLLDAVDFFIAPSPYIAAELERFEIPHSKIKMILHPLETPSNEVAQIRFDAIYAGRLSQEKGIAILLQTIALAPELRFAIVGDGPLAAKVESFAKSHSNLTYFPHRNRRETLSLLSQSRVGVLPSICNEILSLFALEVFSEGKPCVIARQDSMLWFEGGEFPGLLATSGDAVDFVRALKEALAKPALSLENKIGLQKKLAPQRFRTELASVIAELPL